MGPCPIGVGGRLKEIRKAGRARTHFQVVDEAHNLLPKETDKLAAKALLDQFRTIAAEGRKYGLFLILCTQRPDKIDELVISECENQAVMRLGSQSVLDLTTKLLGLEKVPGQRQMSDFQARTGAADRPLGHVVTPTPLYGDAQDGRGAKNLRDEHWAVPYEDTQPVAKTQKSQTKTDGADLPGRTGAPAAVNGPAKSAGAAG
jgi:DNA helicase HerA-like ATPase